MPSLGSFASASNAFLQPRVGPGSPMAAPAPVMNQEQQQAITQQLFNTTYNENRGISWYRGLANSVAGSVVNLGADLVSLAPGIEKQDVWNFVGDYGSVVGEELQNYYSRNQSKMDLISGVAGAIGTGAIAGEILLPRLGSALANSSALNQSWLWQSGARINAATRTAMLEGQAAAAYGGEAFKILSPAGRRYITGQAAKGIGKGLVEEVAIAATMHNNEAIWSDDMSNNLLFGALGLTVGGLIGSVGARAEMRRMANSPEMLSTRANAIDPQGLVGLREYQPSADVLSKMRTMAPAKESAIATTEALIWRQAVPADATPAMVSRMDAISRQAEKGFIDSTQKIASKGTVGVSGTAFRIEGSIGKHIRSTAYQDPMALHGLDSLGTLQPKENVKFTAKAVSSVPTNDPILHQARLDYKTFGMNKAKAKDRMQDMLKTNGLEDVKRYRDEMLQLHETSKKAALHAAEQATQTPLGQSLSARDFYVESLSLTRDKNDIREARRLASQQPNVLVGNTWLPARTPEAHAASAYKPGKVEMHQTTTGVQSFEFKTDSGVKMRVNEAFQPRSGTGAVNFAKLPINDRFEVIEAMNNLFTSMNRSNTAHAVQPKADWFQLDAALAFKARGGKVDLSHSGYKSMEELELASLKMKAKEIGNARLGSYWDRHAYNLPLPSSAERAYDAAGDSMRIILEAADKGATLDAIKRLRSEILATHGFELRRADSAGVPVTGDIYKFNLDANGKWQDMALGFFDSEKVKKPFDARGVAESMAEVKAERFHILMNESKQGGMVGELTAVMHSTKDFQNAMSLRGLSDDQITGMGKAQLMGELVTREFRNRDSVALLGATRTRELANRSSDAFLMRLMTEEMGDVQARLSAAPAAGSKTLVNQFFSNTSGWDLKRVPVDLGDGKYGFTLELTEANAKRLGRPVNKGEMLVNPRTGKQIVLDELGLEYATRFNNVANRILIDKNKIRTALGLAPLREKPWYTPPPNTKGKIVGFTFDNENRLVPGGGIVADTQADYDRMLADKQKNLPAGYVVRTKKSVEETADLADRAAMDWIDPGITVAPGKGQTGTLASDVVNPKALEDSLAWIKNQVEYNGSGTMRVLFDSQLSISRARSAVERAVRSIPDESPLRTIFDEYEATILGKSLGAMERSISGKLLGGLDTFIDGQLENVWPAMSWMAPSQLANWLGDTFQRAGIRAPKASRTFDQLVTQLGPYTPYANAVDYAEQTFKVSRPPEIKEISNKLNRLSSAILLRAFELPMAAMNMIGLITTMPSIVQSGRAPVSTMMNVAGKRVGIIDSMKIMTAAIKDMTSPTAARLADYDIMVRNGDTIQQVADFNKQMASITDRGAFGRIMLGNPFKESKNITKMRSLADIKNTAQAKGIDGLISIATDTTENWSRTWSHFVGLRLADLQGITGVEARHSFAREVANAAIANYNPMNRPEMYHSAFGSMAGLFMSYMQSYNQRLFRWMETGDYISVGRQLAMQTGLFGIASLPGFNAVQAGLQIAGVGKTEAGDDTTIIDQLYARLGPEVGSAFAHGGLSQLGVALYTRGDMNYREPTLDPTKLMASMGIMTQAATMVKEAAQMVFSDQAIENNGRLMEVLARNMPNRVMKGILNQIANEGLDIDSRGAVISENRDFFETAVRMLGVRSTRQQAEIEAFYANKAAMTREANRMDILRTETRSLVRNDPNWQGRIMDVFNKYVETGGRPEHFRTWIQDQVRTAGSTRGVNDLTKAMQNPSSQTSAWRYQAYGAN